MALHLSLQVPHVLSKHHPPQILRPTTIFSQSTKRTPIFATRFQNRKMRLTIAATAEEDKPKSATDTNSVSESESEPKTASGGDEEATALGAEIRKAMREKEEGEGKGFLEGVAEEVREIEWPAFAKVVGTTGVVLGVIAGSSVVLLTVNAVLAELSDRVFAGRGLQDFFG
ncbi:hypothetical protein NMG60_11029920 [Bertholletia excelsa]